MRSCLPRIITWALIAGTAACGGRQDDVQAIRSVVDRYVRSVDNADTVLARQVWADDPGISFIHPLGHERGWEQIRGNVYDRIMGGMLAERRLSIRDLVVKPYGDVAVVEFYWDFDAKWKKDGKPLQTHGRETQVHRRGARGGWQLVHVHYSGMPVTGPAQGL